MPLDFVPDSILRAKAASVESAAEAVDLAFRLHTRMMTLTDCMGLAAPQIGIPKAISIICHAASGVDLMLVNPVVLKAEDPMVHRKEGCMSYPGRRFDVPRFKLVHIEVDSVWSDDPSFARYTYGMPVLRSDMVLPADIRLVKRTAAFAYSQPMEAYGGMVCMAVQHEIDHLNGVVVPFKEGSVEVAQRRVVTGKVGRNDPCPCGSGKKWKKCCGRNA